MAIIQIPLIGQAVLMVIASIIMLYANSKRDDLRNITIVFVLNTVGYVFSALPQETENEVNPIGMIFFLVGMLALCLTMILDYYKTFIKKEHPISVNKKETGGKYAQTAAAVGGATLGFYWMLIILLGVCLFLSIRIFMKKKTLLYSMLIIIFIGGLMSIISQLVNDQEFMYLTSTFTATIYLATGIVALIEVRIMESTKKVEDTSKALQAIINSASEVSINTSNMATELAASANEVNAASEEIASSTQEVTISAQDQTQQMQGINGMSVSLEKLSQEILSSTDDIKKVLKIIINVSEQTNLLALNASIEAGRAGDHGKGFAVVADEVRKLAEETKSSITSSNESVQDIITRIKKSVNYESNIRENIQKSIDSFNVLMDLMEEINNSTQQQTASTEEIAATANRLGSLAEDLKNSLKIE